jgi:cob(I)alamin adenosyltransferase
VAFEDYKEKDSVVVVYTGESKGKTSASIGLMARALGSGWRVGYYQFIKTWDVGEHRFIRKIMPLFEHHLTFYKGGAGFYGAGDISASGVSDEEHKRRAQETYDEALKAVGSDKFELVICDEINNAVHDGLLTVKQLETLLRSRAPKTSLCLTGRNFPEELLPLVDIATDMTKIKHHFDDKFIANRGIDY